MASKLVSAGLLLYRPSPSGSGLEVLLVHPGGPYFAKKDAGAWSIPKGQPDPGENLLDCARREVREEVGLEPTGPFLPLGPIKQKGGKTVHAWACALGELALPDVLPICTFRMEWPPRSGKWTDCPEVDRAEWFSLEAAREKMNAAQVSWLERLAEVVGGGGEFKV